MKKKARDILRPIDKRGKYKGFIETSKILDLIEWASPLIIFYIRYKKYGNPFDKGWLDWPYWFIQVIETLDSIDLTAEKSGSR